MPCNMVKLPGGGVAFVKTAKQRFPKCKFCLPPRGIPAARDATQLCDFEVGRTLGGDILTCDTPVCVHCARHVGDKDFCPKHGK